MTSIPYVDLARQHAPLKGEILEGIARVLDHGQFILGAEVREFEEAFARLCGVGHAVAVASGTDALLLSLRALGIGPGDEVITAPNSFVTTAAAIALVGARPVFVDVREDLNIDPALIEAAITKHTKAIVPVHLSGRPADMEPISAVAAQHGLAVVEDAAQAVLAEYGGKRVGSFGVMGCFSLHPLKTLNACGDAGVITTDDGALAEKARLLRNNGTPTRDRCTVWSGNSRLDSLQAAVLMVKLRHVSGWTEARRKMATRYREALGHLDGIEVPVERDVERSVYHTFVIRAERRDALKDHLDEHGIGSSVHYPVPIHLLEVAEDLGYGPGSFPVTESLAERILSLPIYPELTEAEHTTMIDTIRSFARKP